MQDKAKIKIGRVNYEPDTELNIEQGYQYIDDTVAEMKHIADTTDFSEYVRNIKPNETRDALFYWIDKCTRPGMLRKYEADFLKCKVAGVPYEKLYTIVKGTVMECRSIQELKDKERELLKRMTNHIGEVQDKEIPILCDKNDVNPKGNIIRMNP